MVVYTPFSLELVPFIIPFFGITALMLKPSNSTFTEPSDAPLMSRAWSLVLSSRCRFSISLPSLSALPTIPRWTPLISDDFPEEELPLTMLTEPVDSSAEILSSPPMFFVLTLILDMEGADH